jgi:hypothetical protein
MLQSGSKRRGKNNKKAIFWDARLRKPDSFLEGYQLKFPTRCRLSSPRFDLVSLKSSKKMPV